ncbi:MAG: hypothetical protein HC915_19985 [Anaerolineae bacterium]|nr:hypothetical protein [Anaerolineae bacterium]
MDHSVMQGVELVNRWLLGEPETTWKDFGEHTSAYAPIEVTGEHPLDFRAQHGNGAIAAGSQPYQPTAKTLAETEQAL